MLDEEVAAYYFGDVSAELGLGNIVGDGTLDRIMSKAKGAVGVADTDRNLSNRVLSAIAKYNRVQNRKTRRAEAEAKKAEAAKNKKASKTETEGVVGDNEIRYFINENFSNEIDRWKKNGCPDGERFVLGMTGDVLQGLGAIESDIYMNSDKINTILSDHPEITIDEIKKIPQILEDPVLVLKSQNKRNSGQNTRLVIFSSVKGQNGKPVLAVMDLRPVENNFVIDNMQKVSSAYTKTNSPVEFVKNSEIVYADKKRTTSLLRSIGFQMPIELHKGGYIGSISYVGRKVNIVGEKFDRVFSLDNNDMHNAENNSQSNQKTSKSQTSAKKSKNKTADTVYKKNTKLKVGDTVGAVTLVADSETGTPVTPRLSASFAREDMPSYIMATVESLGDDQLISALEEEMLLMSSDSEAELQLHDTIEELSDHVRDGEITPEQAAQVLSDELANPTGADVDTLVERAKLDGVKYMVDSKNKNNYNVNKNGGLEYGSQDTERVAGGRVSASDRSNNVLRKQGDDSREMSVRLGNGRKGSEFLDFQRQGSSGWLGGVQRFTARSLRGLFGSLRKIKLASIDSLSRTIPNEVYERFENTVLKNHDGTILSLYHFTDVVFSDFSIGDIGFHFGTINAAKKRKDDPRRRRRGEASIYKEVYLNIKQPAITTRDPGKWNVFSASHVLYQEGYLTSNEIESLKTYDGYAPVTSYDSEAAVKFRELLASKGIDGIIYDNGHEGELSVLALYPEQIYTVAENGVDLNNYSDIKFDVESFGNATVRGAYDKVSSSPEALDKVIAEMRADGINIETLVATERERLLGSLSRAYSESKYSGVQGDNRGIISYLEAVETAAKDQNYIKRLIAAEYLAKKQLASSDHSASMAIESHSADMSDAADTSYPEQTSNSVENISVDNSAENGIIDVSKDDPELQRQKKKEILDQNRKRGKEYEIEKFAEFAMKFKDARQQVTIEFKDENGDTRRIRVDAIGFDENGKIVIYEFKSSDTASFTRNQKDGFAALKERGGTIITKDKGPFEHGMKISAGTEVMVQRPGGIEKYVDTRKKQRRRRSTGK